MHLADELAILIIMHVMFLIFSFFFSSISCQCFSQLFFSVVAYVVRFSITNINFSHFSLFHFSDCVL